MQVISKEAQALIDKITSFDKQNPGCLEPEMLDWLDVIALGRAKYPNPVEGYRANWLSPNGSTSSHKDMHDKIFHHLARSFTNLNRLDEEALSFGFRLDHLEFAICRANMILIRIKRGLKHVEDK